MASVMKMAWWPRGWLIAQRFGRVAQRFGRVAPRLAQVPKGCMNFDLPLLVSIASGDLKNQTLNSECKRPGITKLTLGVETSSR